MCGICGQLNYVDRNPVDRADIERMTATMAHRGPDDEGCFADGPVGFGFRRLSIIDIEGGRQPMSDPENRVRVVCNGEIYNFRELREALEGHGHRFRTRSDTEVIVHGYRQWGMDVLSRLNGMFGLAIWDEDRKRLVVARDRMGIKLVYYKLSPGGLAFGSEIRPLLAVSAPPAIDVTALNLFLRYRYTPSPLTIYEGVRKLAPGTCIVAENGACEVRRWCDFRPVPFDPMPSVERAEEELLDLYRRSVKRQLVSDVPLGLLLSGGLDSGLLLGLMKEFGDAWSTYTVGFGAGFADDELADANRTAGIFGSAHTSVKIDRERFESSLPRIIACLEEPIASASIVPMYHVCEQASAGVKVALIGQGPDELMGGYRRHLGLAWGPAWRALPSVFRGAVKTALARVPRSETIRRGLYSLDVDDRILRYQQVFSIMPGDEIDSLFIDGLLPDRAGDAILGTWDELGDFSRGTDELGGFQFLEMRSSLPDELLMYADKLSMAHGLELRVPYLDQEIVEYAERLASSYKVRRGTGKWLHRRVCRKYLPPEILARKKRGFAVNVVDEWFRKSLEGRMSALLRDGGSLIYRYLRPEATRRFLDEHESGRRNHYKLLFSLVVFEEWLRNAHGSGAARIR